VKEVTFHFTAAKDGRAQFHDADGKEIVVESGKNFSTADPAVIATLDASDAVARVKKEKED
jgi:hypothetical protein